jgi:pimeloyl-ACP methyl ester carboxylesterase
MNPTILFIHGMFLNGQSWADWVRFFEWRGYRVLAPSWPAHEGEVAEMRARPPAGLDDLALERVIESYARIVEQEASPPILVGHSVGGLVVQRLVAAGLGEAGVCLASVAPNRLLGAEVGAFCELALRSEEMPERGLVELSTEEFHRDFANVLGRAEADMVHARLVVPESRRVARDCLGGAGRIELGRPHAPLLFVAGDRDRMIPDGLCEENARAYTDAGSVADFRLFPGRGHFLCGEPGWADLAEQVGSWLATHTRMEAYM